MRPYFFLPIFALFSLYALDPDYTPELTKTEHTYTCEGTSLPYTAITGYFPISNDSGKEIANLFFVAYLVEDDPERPITFVFPGGPGGSCGADVICTIGPRRLQTPAEGKSLLPPYRLIDNPESLLPWTDLVFIDPVDTGYSKFTENAEENDIVQFFNTDGDIAALGDFVQIFTAYFQKWNCPKYLSGSSYGTVRCCGLAEYLLSYDFSLHGIILLGSAMDYATLLAQHNQPLPNCLLIPTFAATAWYHGRLWPDASLEEVIDYARRFCYDDYAPFMMQPTRLSIYEQNVFYAKLSELIGLTPETVRRYCGRFDESLYTNEFLASERKVIGGLDTRYIGDLSSTTDESSDPSYRDMQGLWCAFNAYLQKELETGRPFQPYVAFSRKYWNFSTYDSIAWPEVFQRVRRTLIHNPSMKVFSGSGYYDCRTPFAATEYCFDHMELPPSYKGNLQFEYYEAGHGFIFDAPSLKKLKQDLVKFYESH